MKRRRIYLKITSVACAVIVALATVLTLVINLKGTAERRATFAELQRRGLWPDVPSAFEPSVGSRSYNAAVAVLRDSAFDAATLYALDDTGFGRAIDKESAALLGSYVDAHADFYAHMDAALTSDADPLFGGFDTWAPASLDGAGDVRAAARALNYWSLHAQTTGEADAALAHVAEILRLRARWADEPDVLQYLIEVSLAAIAYGGAHTALSRTEPSGDALRRLDAELASIDLRREYAGALRHEVVRQGRALADLDRRIDDALTAIHDMADAGVGIGRSIDPLFGVLPEPLQSSEPDNVKLDIRLTRWCYAVWPGHWKVRQAHQVRLALATYDRVSGLSPAAADYWQQVMVSGDDGISAQARIGMQAEAAIKVTRAALAIDAHRQEHGDWPASLAEIGAAQDDPCSGSPLRYRRLPDGVTVYSVGHNGTDEGGVQDVVFDHDADIAFRLLDPALRGTLAPPEDDAVD